LAATQVDFAGQLAEDAHIKPDGAKHAALRQPLASKKHAIAFIAPRGIGPTAWNPAKETHIRRRFMLLGQTLDGMRVWDVRRAIQTLRAIEGLGDKPLSLHARGNMAGIALYAALFEPQVNRLELHNLPESHMHGPDFLNVLRFLDVPQTVAMVAEKSQVMIRSRNREAWEYPAGVADTLGWKNSITIEKKESSASN
jgi:hypothetical protein